MIDMARLQQVKEQTKTKGILPVIFDKNLAKRTLKGKEKSKLDIFEAGLANELSATDTMETSVEKIVRMALTCEFGTSLVTKPGAAKMITTICNGIMGSSELRRSALIIADRFAGTKKEKQVVIRSRGRRKAVLNG
jgi:hypothetical protein